VIEALRLRGLWPDNAANARAASKSQGRETDEDYEFVSPVPSNSPDPNITAEFLANRFGATDAVRFDYRNAKGEPLFHVYRFEPPGKDKEIRPLSLWRDRVSRNLRWRFKWPPRPLPLYALDRLAEHPELPVLLLEGEAKTDPAAGGNYYVPVGLPSGAKAIDKVDLSPLAGRRVTTWPDNDRDGFHAMAKVARLIEGAQIKAHGAITQNVRIVKPNPTWPVAHDIANLIEAGWNAERLYFIASSSVGIDNFEQYARERFGKSDDLQRTSGAAAPVGVFACDVKAEPVRWLWSGYMPRGKVSDFQGDPGQGKSLLCVDIASRISAGGKFPDGSQAEGGNVIIVSAEDDAGDTLRPRLEAAGAELKRVRLITVRDRLPTLPDDLPQLRDITDADKAVLICFDPLDAFISDKIDSHKNQSIRRLIAQLATLAAETGIAVLVIRHLNKDSKTSNPMYRGGGSIGLNAAARSVFVIGSTTENPDLHVLAWVKGNLGKKPPALGYRIVEREIGGEIKTAKLDWLESPLDVTARDLLREPVETRARGPKPDKLEAAKALIAHELGDGVEHPGAHLDAAARVAGISIRTMNDAARALGVRRRKGGFADGWL
jgi:hypothetical protein